MSQLNIPDTIQYTGIGTARLIHTPQVVVSGPTRVTASAQDGVKVEMVVSSIQNFELQEGEENIQLPPLDFQEVVIETDTGRIVMTGNVHADSKRLRLGSEPGSYHIGISAQSIVFTENDVRDAEFLVMPLLNFATDFSHRTNQKIIHSRYCLDDGNAIAFGPDGFYGFILPVAKYNQYVEELREEKVSRHVTAVMTCNAPKEELSFWLLKQQVFNGILPVLTFATGSEVGCPWIESYDIEGRLCGRYHVNWNVPRYHQGHSIVDADRPDSIGNMVLSALTSEAFGNLYYRVAIVRCVRSQYRGYSIEDSLSQLFRAVDNLCERYDFTSYHIDGIIGDHRKEIEQIKQDAVTAIENVKRMLDDKCDSVDELREVLSRIENNFRFADKLKIGFGKSVVRMVEAFSFNDVSVLQQYFQNEYGKQLKWGGWLSGIRGKVMHRGYIDSQSNPTGRSDVGLLMTHLYDLLTRILLRIIGYAGEYRSSLGNQWRGIDWVSPDTSPTELGFRDDMVIDVEELKDLIRYGMMPDLFDEDTLAKEEFVDWKPM